MFSLTDLKADEKSMCTLPEATGSAPQEIDPSKENQLLFTYSVHWEVRELWEAGWQLTTPGWLAVGTPSVCHKGVVENIGDVQL